MGSATTLTTLHPLNSPAVVKFSALWYNYPMGIRKYPIGIQSFEDIRTDGYVYVDKTPFIYRMVTEGKPYFLSRPRRFGKSLLLSTLKAYFEGKKELFLPIAGQPGLAIADREKEWRSCPVFHLDFNAGNYCKPGELDAALNAQLARLEAQWGKNPGETSFSTRFWGLIERAAAQTGRKAVVLIDEYDKPLLEAPDEAQREDARNTLRAFYGVLKSADPCLKFYLITGITRFSKVSIFSNLNQLYDLSLDGDYASLCGISPAELSDYFTEDIKVVAEKNNVSFDEAMAEMRKRYNGYCFAEKGERVYNPVSLLNTLKRKEFHYYWFETGTPVFLVKALANINFDLPSLKDDITISAASLMDYRFDDCNPVPILYQSGYLTIKKYDRDTGMYTLGFPNGEVEYGFLKELLPLYSHWVQGSRQGLYKGTAEEALQQIDGKGYLLPYHGEGKRLVKVGVEFDREKRTIGKWIQS
jgi:hypothetical protein